MVDLFCGCGGISRGFQRTGRFAVEYGVELEKHPALAFHENITNSSGGKTRVYQGDIRELLKSRASLWDELGRADIHNAGQIDVLAGGPPCQGFSRNGVRQYSDSGRRFYDDPRNHLYKAFLDVIESLQPKIVLIENVREFVNYDGGKFSEDLLKKLDELGYIADFRKMCAADFGVPQLRHRVFFVAVNRNFVNIDSAALPFPTAHFVATDNQLSLIGGTTYRTVRDAIGDLPNPLYEHGIEIPYEANSQISEFAREMRSTRGLVSNHVARRLSVTSKARIQAVGTGRMKHIEDALKTKSFYGSAYRRLHWDEPALTITTWVYHVGSGRFAHPVEDRCITMREAARLQGFDDDFVFPNLINPVSQMIGNAVPPMLAKCFADSFQKLLDANAKPDEIRDKTLTRKKIAAIA